MPASLNDKVLEAAVSRFTAFAHLSERDLSDLMALAGGRRSLNKGDFVCEEGDAPAGLYLLLEGWAASSITFPDGTRQLIKVHLPGDMLGMPSLALRRAADSIVALTPIAIGFVSPIALGHLFERNPRLAALLFLISQEERVMLIDRVASMGASDARGRLAALLLQIRARVSRSSPTTRDEFDLPLSQSEVADLVGVSAVHLNRTIQHMRAAGLITWSAHRVEIHNLAAMAEIAGTTPRELERDPYWLPATTSTE